MTCGKLILANLMIFDDWVRNWAWITNVASIGQIVSVHKPNFLLLEDRVEESKYLTSKKFIITVNNHHYLLWFTEFIGCSPLIIQGQFLLFIDNDRISLGGDYCLIFQKYFNLFTKTIGRCIIDKDNMIIFIFLHEDRLHIFDVSIILGVVKARYNNTDWKFSSIFA